MKLNFLKKQLSTLGRWMATALFFVSAVTFVWQGAFFSNAASADPAMNLVASRDVGDQAQDKASRDAGRTKGFIRDTANKVERTANKNASRVERATDGKGNLLERKAKRDADRIELRAEQDAARTQRAVDKTKNAFERTVDNIKDAFSD